MSDDTRKPESQDNEPQVFAVSKNLGGKWLFNRRDFVKTAGVAAAGMAAGTGALASCSSDKSPSLNGARSHEYISSMAISPDGTLLVSAGHDDLDPTIKLWSLPAGEFLNTLALRKPSLINSVAFSPDGKLLAAGGRHGEIALLSLPEGTLVRMLQHGTTTETVDINSVAFTPDGAILASGSDDGNVKLWLPLEEKPTHILGGHTSTVNTVDISPDGTLLASGSFDQTIKLWSLPEGELLRTLESHTDEVQAVTFSPDGTRLASINGRFQAVYGEDENARNDYAIRLWSIPDGELLQKLEGHSDLMRSVAFSPDGTLLASNSFDRTIKLWSMPTGEVFRTLTCPDGVSLVVFSPDGTLLASASNEKIRLWALPEGKHLMDLIDIAISFNYFKGLQYSQSDGAGVVTLPCGSSIPGGAACICNCVEGASCSCVGHQPGSGSGGGGSDHYWHPN